MNYYSFRIGDYRRDTMHLSRLEHSIYRDLIDWYYLDEKPIPLETQSVMRRLRLVSQEEAKALQSVLNDFFVQADGWRHARIDADISSYHANTEKNRLNGKLGGRPKKTQSVPSGLPDETQPKGNQEPRTNNQEPVEKQKQRAPRFDAQAHLVGLEVDPAIAADWIKLRKSKRAEVTATAIDGIVREAEKAGLSLDAALRECCSRGWAGFKADWMRSRDSPTGRVINPSLEERNKAVAAAWVPPELRGAA